MQYVHFLSAQSVTSCNSCKFLDHSWCHLPVSFSLEEQNKHMRGGGGGGERRWEERRGEPQRCQGKRWRWAFLCLTSLWCLGEEECLLKEDKLNQSGWSSSSCRQLSCIRSCLERGGDSLGRNARLTSAEEGGDMLRERSTLIMKTSK